MQGQLFYSSRPVFVLVATTIVLMAMAVVGFWIGRRASQRGVDQSSIGTIQSSVLGMLALMLGFTFGAAWTRYDTRRVLAVDEANAIGTTFMRAQTLPEPYRTNLSNMLRSYVDLRLKSASQLNDLNQLIQTRRETERMQQAMWRQVALAARRYPNPVTAIFEQTLNESIDLYSSRVALFFARVPTTIMWILALISATALGIVGYGFGLAGQQRWLTSALVSFIVAAVIVMIVDLDRPEAGPTRISHQSMADLKGSLAGYEEKRR